MISVDELPHVTVAEILDPHIEGCAEFEAFLDKVEAENRPYIVNDEMSGQDFVMVPYAMWAEMRARIGDALLETIEVPHDTFAEAFKAARGRLGAGISIPDKVPNDDFAAAFTAARGRLGTDHDLEF